MNKKQIVEQISTNSTFSRQTLSKMNLPELKKLFAEISSSKQQQPEPDPEPKSVARREPVLRDFSSDDDEEEESEEENEPEPPVKKRISNVEKKIKKAPKKNKNKIKPPKVEIQKEDEDEDEDEDEGNKSPTPPPSPKPLSTSELRKVLRADYFKHYEKDIKEVISEYRRGDFSENSLVVEYNLLRDEFVERLQSFLDSQRKLSEVQLDYVDSLLQRVADKVQEALNKR
jgi:hypothetical protein